jgi:FkbM family methyltransferase
MMKAREWLYLLGLRPGIRTYPTKVVSFTLPGDGEIRYARWLHPGESPKVIRQAAVDELRRFIRPGDVAIDIGAHTGDTTIPMALAAGPTGCVLALEPNPYVFRVLEENARLNVEKARIVPLMFAATEAPGEFTFQYSDAGFCNGGLHPGVSRWRHGHAFDLTVRGENLSSYLASHFPELLSRIRFIKVDTEGYDAQVIASLHDLIDRQRPFLKAEVYKQLSLAQRELLYDVLIELDYAVFVVVGDDRYVGQPLERQQLMAKAHYDIFCVPRDGRHPVREPG